jgi:hypothetical protein
LIAEGFPPQINLLGLALANFIFYDLNDEKFQDAMRSQQIMNEPYKD